MPKPRVFASCPMDGYEEYRMAAREGIIAAGCEPVMVEDFPSLDATPRNACLDGVASADATAVVIFDRGGWTTPSGKLATEEEFDEAVRLRRTVLVFVQEVDRTADAGRLEGRVSDYVSGRFRKTFRTPGELASLVEEAVREASLGHPSHTSSEIRERMDSFLGSPVTLQNQASIRMVLIPERDEQVFDPVQFERPEFKTMVNEVAHGGDRAALSYDHGKSYEVGLDSFVVHQKPGQGLSGAQVRIELFEDGTVVLDRSVTGLASRRPPPGTGLQDAMTIHEDAIREALTRGFVFVASLYQRVDAFERHQRFSFNAKLHNTGYRTIAADDRPKNSYGSRMTDNDVVAFPRPRLLGRRDLADPAEEVEAALQMFKRQLSSNG